MFNWILGAWVQTDFAGMHTLSFSGKKFNAQTLP